MNRYAEKKRWEDMWSGDADKIERTSATAYQSVLYPTPLTPEYVTGVGPGDRPKRGQMPHPYNRWTPFDTWYTMTNNWFHRINDRHPLFLFGDHIWHVFSTVESEPSKKERFSSLYYSTRRYNDNILGQTLGNVAMGLQIGGIFGILHCFNVAKEAGIFQSAAMPQNQWLPLHVATPAFRARIVITCMAQASTFFGTWGLVDACSSTFRQKDDIFNALNGGIAAGFVLYAWFRNPLMTVPLGLIWGMYESWIRFSAIPDDSPKRCIDFERPLLGVMGGAPAWLLNEEPYPDRVVYNIFDSKWRDGNPY